MSELRETWWRVFADLFILKKITPLTITDSLAELICPCHEDWFSLQPWHDNDNRRQD